MKVIELFPRENLIANLAATEKNDAIREMVKQMVASGSLPRSQSAAVERALIRREELGSTGIGRGGAVPHAKVPSVKGIVGAFARSTKGVEFASLDGQPVFLIFLLVSSPDSVEPHLEALRKVTALLMKDNDFCNFLRRAKDEAELAELLREADDRLAR